MSVFVSSDKDIVLDLIFWKTKATHRLAALRPRGWSGSGETEGASSPSASCECLDRTATLKTNITHAGLPETVAFLSLSLECWFPSKSNNKTLIKTRVGEIFKLDISEQGKFRLTYRQCLLTTTRRVRITIQTLQTKIRHAYLPSSRPYRTLLLERIVPFSHRESDLWFFLTQALPW
ncbi:MAG: hypothetical protein J3R72DRAFT_448100 [Linnemannia gamsii]|nr:MAG: hypothetical protein J3R72DRAFT_448100 [Linnemannia gamsii]